MKTTLSICFISVLLCCSTVHAVDGDFGRRYGANSPILQEPLYFKDTSCEKNTCVKKDKKKKKSKTCKCNPCKCKDCKC